MTPMVSIPIFSYYVEEIKMENVDLKTARLCFALIAGILSAYLARKGNRNPLKWFCIGSALGFFGVLPIFFLPMKKQTRTRRAPAESKISFIDGPANKFWYYLDGSQN